MFVAISGVSILTIAYKTSRLLVVEIVDATTQSDILVRIPELLTAKVVEKLPPHFSNIISISDADDWLKKMVAESRLLVVKSREANTIIGFVFIFVEHDTDAHIGYLLGESYWKKGYATELLSGLIEFIIKDNKWCRLIAGVDTSNKVSSRLLLKLGFIERQAESDEMLFYEYQLPKSQ